jgi:hypothetical protein
MERSRKSVFVNDMFTLTKSFKMGLVQVLHLYPSPRRLRQVAVAEVAAKEASKLATLVPKQKAAVQSTSSKFSQGPSKERSTADRLAQLLWKGK